MNLSEISIWNQTQNKLKSFVFRYTKDRALTDDIIQDVFLKVHSRLGQLKESDKLIGWIFQITRNTITDYFRSKGKTINVNDIDWEVENNSLNDCVVTCLQDMMTTLPEKYRNALELTELNNLSQLELAKKLNISYSGAKSRVQRARQMLKEKMDAAYQIKFDSYGNVIVCEDRVPCSCRQEVN
ncbi:MAG TPA: sigma-70 family RNA polymerase sigma factor [Cyclobacteriaceae bacterium]|nr:sigma-70 family RNA polymerase sigma factor [Cyclobacteriaceae bacterium]